MGKTSLKLEFNSAFIRLNLLFLALFFSALNAHAICVGTLIKEINAIATRPEVIEAVKASNSRRLTVEQIVALDEKWVRHKGRLPEAEQIKNSQISTLLALEINKKIYFTEAILTGNQGETIGMNMVTTDYWQGDEEKFTAIFDTNQPSRKPDSLISRARWDESTQAMIAQVSVPVYDADTMIGTLTVGVDLKRVPQSNH